ncbi:oocyte zinc finger protein XlCOF6-like [Cylas formicarius]|uniref:oocyte zinc finger protein XlCOF6-like n=1 Tax=Cylas formicarius TaxID=197179 RepID=UPI00295854CD|nr:oocyte zinc finger protein XlCOF6-like [Cylas formicarius]
MATIVVCRVCLKKQNSQDCKSLLEASEEGLRIVKMLIYCFPDWNMTIVADPVICGKCKKYLRDAYHFKRMCVKNEKKLKSYSRKYCIEEIDIMSFISSETHSSQHSDNNNNHKFIKEQSDKSTTCSLQQRVKQRSSYRKRYTCQDCLGCKNRIRDVVYHKGPFGDSCVCSTCNNTFTIKDLRKHIYSHLSLIECHLCNKRCRDKTTLKVHLRSHTKERPFECPVCNKKFAQSYALNMHMGTHSDGTTETKCQECGKILSTKYNLKIHMMSHDVSRKLTCFQCGRSYYTQSALEKHLPICGSPVTKKRVTCHNCRKWFFNANAFQQHIALCDPDIKEEEIKTELIVIKAESQLSDDSDDYFTESEEISSNVKVEVDGLI